MLVMEHQDENNYGVDMNKMGSTNIEYNDDTHHHGNNYRNAPMSKNGNA